MTADNDVVVVAVGNGHEHDVVNDQWLMVVIH